MQLWPWRWFRRNTLTVVLGGERFEVEPISLANLLDLALLMAPYLAKIEVHLPEIQAALSDRSGQRVDTLTVVFRALRRDMQEAPGDMIRAIALLVDREPEWLAQNATAQEFFEALPVIDRVNDLGRLWGAIRAMGVTTNYKEEAGN